MSHDLKVAPSTMTVPAERLELAFTGPGDEPVLAAAIERLRRRVKPLGAPHRGMDD